VETEQQREQLRALECESGQGFYFSRPMDSGAAEAFFLSCFPPAGHQPQAEICGTPPVHAAAASWATHENAGALKHWVEPPHVLRAN
jgi:predicted signal transduction protein with EAL and GGDEF domain